MTKLILPKGYKSKLDLRESEKAIKLIKDFFQKGLSTALNLERASAPLFVRSGSGINDDLNGVETKVTLTIKDGGIAAECLFSLAKWKRMVLADYGFKAGEGIYTDMNAIRPDEGDLDNLHSVYVDQWDWERAISKKERNLDFLKEIVKKIYRVMKDTEKMIHKRYPEIIPVLPNEIKFVHTEELVEMYPRLSRLEREDAITKKYGAVFLIGIGAKLKDGKIHDGRAPDYDDWITPTTDGKKGLNGDIIVWNRLLDRSFELSSMGIRVDKESLIEQLKVRNCLERKEMEWHKRLLNEEFPLSIGGGIGQSRLCMFFLQKAHVGEVQASVWPEEMIETCKNKGIYLL